MDYLIAKFIEGFVLGIARSVRGLAKHTSENKFKFNIVRFVGSMVLSGIVGAIAFTMFDQVPLGETGEGAVEGAEQLMVYVFSLITTWYATGAVEDGIGRAL